MDWKQTINGEEATARNAVAELHAHVDQKGNFRVRVSMRGRGVSRLEGSADTADAAKFVVGEACPVLLRTALLTAPSERRVS